ncbi:hypothetical protein AAFF_G00235270 [Aldrovandia affinis]|uniref:Uncharacterized protein n=1 Tax=Aldrovandia affinis TaxID=143900 RepID=A0AAD7SV07_9TELE|nr:hypothetical protein AAFF_G00235270 [Aldrovandia affinis]
MMKVNCHTLFRDYCASKFGAVGFHKSLTHKLLTEEGLDGIKTMLVCPYIIDTGMFTGRKIREEVQSLVPALDCIQQAMNAILAEQHMVCIPRLMYLPLISRALLPWDANVLTYRFMGADMCMYPFIQTMEQRVANGHTKPT